MPNAKSTIDGQSWAMLLILSLLWGGSFMFIGMAVKELPALLIVFARVGLAAVILVPVHLLLQGPLPREGRKWLAFAGMSLLNNVIPFTLIVWGQHYITAGLASVINATTPMFGALVMALAGVEALTGRKITGMLMGLAGVMILKGLTFTDFNQEVMGILAVLLASASYGLSALWAKLNVTGIPPVTSATCQLIISTLIMGVLVALFSDATLLLHVSNTAWLALFGLAALSTAIAYFLFFRIIARAGPSAVILVTMIIPVSAIILGHFVLGEVLKANELIGALMIGAALLVIDGRALKYMGLSRS